MRSGPVFITKGLSLTLPQFRDCADYANTLLGKLFIALTEETIWSNEYAVHVSFIRPTCLTIAHKSFVPDGSALIIEKSDWTGWNVRRVEDAIRAHLDSMTKSARAKMESLQGQIVDLYSARENIDKEKARAALAAAFPEAGEFAQFSPEPTEIFCFGKNMDATPAYLVRMIDHESVGVACLLDFSAVSWHLLNSGIKQNERHGVFWAALARAFAARELKIAESELMCDEVHAVEKPWEKGTAERYIVGKVVLKSWGLSGKVVTTFGADNLPANVDLVPE